MRGRIWLGVCVFVLLSAAPASAMPVAPGQRIVLEQPSGGEFTAKPFGDEWYHGFETLSGYTLVRDPDSGAWVYGRETQAGDVVASGLLPAAAPPAGTDPHARDEDRLQAADELRDEAVAPAPAQSPAPLNNGTQKALVILVEYANQTSATAASSWNQRFFGATDSVSDYYDEVSYGDLQISAAAETHGTASDGVVGWLTLGTNHPNATNLGNGFHVFAAQSAVRDAISAADPYVNFASYDADSDGSIEAHELHITVIPAGYEASDGACAGNRVWGHKFGAGALNPTVDGVVAGGDYTMFGERHCSGGEHLATLGIMAHEIGHDLDMPDLYDTDGSSNGGVGSWSVMANGSWLSLPGSFMGSHPPHPDAFLKSFQGWVEPEGVTGPRRIALPQAETTPAAIRLGANANGVDWTGSPGTGEYFLVENREQTGYDQALPGCGLIVWHVDETRSGNTTDARRLIDLEEADNGNSPFDAGDAFTSGSFTQTSSPNSSLYSGAASNARLRHLAGGCSSSLGAHYSIGTGVQSNDDFASSRELTGWLEIDRTADSNSGASTESGEPAVLPTNSGGASVWYRWTAPSNASTTVTTAGSSFDTALAVFGGASFATLNRISFNDDSGAGLQSAVTFQAAAGTTYRIAVDGFNNGTGAAEGALQIHLDHADTPPVAVADAFTVSEDSQANTFGVLGNDTDSNGGPKTIESATQPSHGTRTAGSAAIAYTPTANYCGPDSLTYTLNGGSTATVSITVECIDDPPAAVADSVTVAEDAAATEIDPLQNDTDIDGGPKSITSMTTPDHGQLGTSAGGAVTYQPNPGYCGPDGFSYTLNGGASAAVSIDVSCADDAPVAVADGFTVTEDAAPTDLTVLANDTDTDGGPKVISSVGDPPHGSATAQDDAVSYQPDQNYCGPDSFEYTLNGGSSTTVTLDVGCVEDMPVAQADIAYFAQNGAARDIAVLANDTDVDGGPKTISTHSTPAHGTALITPGGSGITYGPASGYCGPDQFVYHLNGGSQATVSVLIICPPDTTAPQTTLGARPKKRTRSRTARFEFSASEPAASFSCAIDKRPSSACRSPKTYRNLRPGSHVLKVAAVDAAGNRDASPAVYRWRITR